MDNFVMHLAPLPRRFPAGMPVQSIGYVPVKKDIVRHAFTTLNFSVILSGEGVYHFRGERFEIHAPSVITQWPDEPMDYGPLPGGSWEELYIIYSASSQEEIQRRGLAQIHKPFWAIRRDTQVFEQFAHLTELLKHMKQDGAVDRIDRVCELLLMETRLGEHRPEAGRGEKVVRQIRQYVREHLLEVHDFDALALKHGLAPATFRRYWSRYVHEPPARYVMILRMREARRLLVETDLTIGEIAGSTGFEDPLYFSRCFRHLVGMPPSNYRARFPR